MRNRRGDSPSGVQSERYRKRERQEYQLARDEDEQLRAARGRTAVRAHARREGEPKIVVELPLDGHHAIQEPHIQMLPAVDPRARMMRRQPAEPREIDIGVVARHVDERVMEHVVLPVPEIGAAANEIEAFRHQAIHEAAIGVRFMARVVHHVEADRDDRQP